MGILSFLSPLWGMTHKPKPEPDPYAPLVASLQPYLNSAKTITEYGTSHGTADLDKARENYDYVLNYLKTLFEGDNEQLMGLLNADELTASFDEQDKQLTELGTRGGRRASDLGGLKFDKTTILNKALTELRNSAPADIANIAQAIANMGQGELNAANAASSSASNILFGVQQLKDIRRAGDKDRKSALIGSILGAAGRIAGAAAAG